MPTTAEAMSEALRCHMAGRLHEAAQIYAQIVAVEPDNAFVWHLMAGVAHEMGQIELAIDYIHQSVSVCPEYAQAHNDLGNLLQEQLQYEAAAACYRRALELEPERVDIRLNLATAYEQFGQFQDAIECYSKLLSVNPEHAEAHNNLGCCLMKLRSVERAETCFRRALAAKPDYAAAHHNLGRVWYAKSDYGEALSSFRQALDFSPNSPEALIGLGATLQMLGRLDEAFGAFAQAISFLPESAEAHCGLGNAFKDQGRLEDAVASYRRATEVNPSHLSAHSNYLYALYFHPNCDPASIYQEHVKWGERCCPAVTQGIQPHSNDRSPNRRLRVGYVSPHFTNHCQSFFTLPLLTATDRGQVDTFCYSDVACPDATTARLRKNVENWREIAGLGDEQVVERIHNDRIDILVDLTMHMEEGRPLVFARKPAPVQVCWLAYPGTTGNSAIDYRLTDPFLDPPGRNDRYYTENSVRLADTFWCYDPLTKEPVVNSLPALSRGQVTFGCLNNFCKVNTGIVTLWARVLRAVDGSRLMLLAPEGSARSWVLETFEREDVGQERIAFVSRQSRQKYLELHHQIDIGLDTLPYNGHTTSLDALWMGVPVVTMVGQTVVGRAGLSQLSNLELTEFVAETPEEFVRIAVEAASDLPRLTELRSSLRGRMEQSPLMDASRFAQSMEAAYRAMWLRWCAR